MACSDLINQSALPMVALERQSKNGRHRSKVDFVLFFFESATRNDGNVAVMDGSVSIYSSDSTGFLIGSAGIFDEFSSVATSVARFLPNVINSIMSWLDFIDFYRTRLGFLRLDSVDMTYRHHQFIFLQRSIDWIGSSSSWFGSAWGGRNWVPQFSALAPLPMDGTV